LISEKTPPPDPMLIDIGGPPERNCFDSSRARG